MQSELDHGSAASGVTPIEYLLAEGRLINLAAAEGHPETIGGEAGVDFIRARVATQSRSNVASVRVHQIDAPVAISVGGEGDGRAIGRKDRRVLFRKRLSEMDRLASYHGEADYIRLVTPVSDAHHRLAVRRQGRLGIIGWIVRQAIELISIQD